MNIGFQVKFAFFRWCGDPTKLFLLNEVMKVIKRDKLIEQAKDVGEYFQGKLQQLQACKHTVYEMMIELQKNHSSLLSQARGRGTFAAIDLPNPQARDRLVEVVGFFVVQKVLLSTHKEAVIRLFEHRYLCVSFSFIFPTN